MSRRRRSHSVVSPDVPPDRTAPPSSTIGFGPAVVVFPGVNPVDWRCLRTSSGSPRRGRDGHGTADPGMGQIRYPGVHRASWRRDPPGPA
jgi:hypothetical protein